MLPSPVEYNSMSKRIKSAPSQAGVTLLTIDVSSQGQRVDNFLARHLRGVPRSHIYRLLRSGQVRVNGGRIQPRYRLQPGDRLRVPPVRRTTPTGRRKAPPAGLLQRFEGRVLHEDPGFIVLDKPAGVAVHGGTGNPWGVIELLRAGRPDLPELALAHRLDRDTSGCLVLAKHRPALLAFQTALRAGTVVKEYQVLLRGRVRQRRWRVTAPLSRRSGAVRVDPRGRSAHTEFEVLKHLPGATLARVRLHTGRMHQIRVHAAHAGHPVLGDDKYGDFTANRHWRALGLGRLFLHAASLRFDSGRYAVSTEAPLPAELEAVLARAAS